MKPNSIISIPSSLSQACAQCGKRMLPAARLVWDRLCSECSLKREASKSYVEDVTMQRPQENQLSEPKQDEQLGTNPKDLLGIKKVQLQLVPPAAKIYCALAMEDGAVKYGPFNWREKKVKASVYVGAAQRHLEAYYDGENDAPDSKKPHLAHAIASLAILIDALETGNLVDDRPKPGAAGPLITKLVKS